MTTYQLDYQNWKFRILLGTKKWRECISNLVSVKKKKNKLFKKSIHEAANAISRSIITKDSHREAINILKDGFNNKQLIILSHIVSLVKLPIWMTYDNSDDFKTKGNYFHAIIVLLAKKVYKTLWFKHWSYFLWEK